MPEIKKSGIEISLTDFVDFVCKTGSTKLTHVRTIKQRGEYSPATDFYKPLREGIKEIHQCNGSKKELNKILLSLTDPNKIKNYPGAIDGYKKFWGRKDLNFFEPPHRQWEYGKLGIRINPELGLEFNDKFYIVKLYFKSDTLSKNKVEQILTLMENQLREGVPDEVKMAILDVRNAKIFSKEDKDLSLLSLLRGEARNFEEIWKSI